VSRLGRASRAADPGTLSRADFAERAPIDRDAVLAWLGSDQGIVATPHSQRSTATCA
jgi:hypothetical protein